MTALLASKHILALNKLNQMRVTAELDPTISAGRSVRPGFCQARVVATWRAMRASSRWSVRGRASSAVASGSSR